ncbi:hypothetical protein PSM7751_03288 [Pseudooceanicola marinus]|uniref:Uncharacterized protein n=1 Tax=Pseudooceanicola marinus TaxID=396013 RepID=A0A1X6ZXK1_9RHOB|nr:hypothetical protein [Pseudooceanicola marinus]PJE30036.1 hypothetical protein CVM50_11095 [Pseudooceanicola marinus]SLN64604.1 hypothetical protein PSM7751_03288 [Pseudooceanicola marinus]
MRSHPLRSRCQRTFLRSTGDLVGTLTDDAVAGPAADELHMLIDTVVVTWDAEERIHWLEVQGKLLE